MIILRKEDIIKELSLSKKKKITNLTMSDFNSEKVSQHHGHTVVYLHENGCKILKHRNDDVRKTKHPIMSEKEYNQSVDKAKDYYINVAIPQALARLRISPTSPNVKQYIEQLTQKFEDLKL